MNVKKSEQLLHLAKAEKEWNESYYFVFYDKKLNLGGMTRLGFKANKNEGSAFLILFLPNGSAAMVTSTVATPDERRKDMRAGGMSHQRLPDGSWRYTFEGTMVVSKSPENLPRAKQHPQYIDRLSQVSLDLSFTPFSDTYEYSENMTAESRELGRKSGDAHWEQIGTAEGHVKLDNETFQVRNVIGQRDHTHGVRDWTGIGDWLYYVVWFDEDLCINPAAIVAEDGRISSGGFIFEHGENVPIRSIRVISQEFRDNVYPVSSKIEVTDALNRRHILEGKPRAIVPVPFTDDQGGLSVLTQSFGEFVLDGRGGGYGSFETLRKTK